LKHKLKITVGANGIMRFVLPGAGYVIGGRRELNDLAVIRLVGFTLNGNVLGKAFCKKRQ